MPPARLPTLVSCQGQEWYPGALVQDVLTEFLNSTERVLKKEHNDATKKPSVFFNLYAVLLGNSGRAAKQCEK